MTAIVAVCESIKRGLVASGVSAEKIEVIYSGTDTDRFHPGVDGRAIRQELSLAPDHFLITQIGVRSWRGNSDVIEAMARVTPRAPHARLLVVGARNPAALYERAQAHGIREAVHVLGYREDIPEILRGSDCCVDASWAGLGLTGALREALAVETPVVASDLAGNPELVRDGVTGLLFPAARRGRPRRGHPAPRRRPRARAGHGPGRARGGPRPVLHPRQGRADGSALPPPAGLSLTERRRWREMGPTRRGI